MPGFAPGFDDSVNKSILPINSQPLTNRLVKNGLVGTAIGAAAGVSTVVNKSRVKANTTTGRDNFGTNSVEAESLINRNSAAADITELKRVTTKKRPSLAFPRDLSGNGGPAFTRV